MRTESQKNKILKWLNKGFKITALTAFNRFGCMRLGARIWELRKEGKPIKDNLIKTDSGKWVKQYWLAK